MLTYSPLTTTATTPPTPPPPTPPPTSTSTTTTTRKLNANHAYYSQGIQCKQYYFYSKTIFMQY